MSERGPKNWRAWLAAGVFVALLIVAFLIVGPAEPPEVDKVEPTPRPPDTPVVPAQRPPLNRADLIDAAARAADAHAQGRPAPPENAELVGQRFTLRLPFGCDGARTEDSAAPAWWSYDAEHETLRASFRPETWTDADFVRSIGAGIDFEAAEGYWISRPWMRVGECPAAPPSVGGTERPELDLQRQSASERGAEQVPNARAGSTTSVPETLALVEFFEVGSRRAARRNGRPYSLVTDVPPHEIDLGRGLRLVIEGRLAALPGGQPIACRADNRDQPPLCLISVNIARVSITDASGERTLAKWTD